MKKENSVKVRCNFLIIFLLLKVVFLFASGKVSADIPYEECNWKSKEYTERIVKDAYLQTMKTGNICEECSLEDNRASVTTSSQINASNLKDALEFPIPFECFFAAATRKFSTKGSKRRFYYCESPENKAPKEAMKVIKKGKIKYIYPRSPCFNEAYISLIANSFHYMAQCFGFNRKERQNLFSLFNHESSFIFNKKSGTGARCIGQITKDTVLTMNKYIYMSNDELLRSYHNIYREALENCPDLNIKARLPAILSEESNPTYSKLKKINKSLRVTCLTTQDPYACFFYSMYNYQVNKILLEKELASAHDNLQIKKTPVYIFDKETKEALVYWSYNGGISIIKDYLKEFLRKKHLQITQSESSPECKSAPCKWRRQIESGQPLDFDISTSEELQAVFQKFNDIDTHKWKIREFKRKKKPSNYKQLIEEKKEQISQLKREIESFTTSLREETIGKGEPPERFTDYLWLEYNGGNRRKAEVIQFISKIQSDFADISNIQTKLQKMHEDSSNKPDKKKQEDFLESVKNKCSF